MVPAPSPVRLVTRALCALVRPLPSLRRIKRSERGGRRAVGFAIQEVTNDFPHADALAVD